VRLSAIHVYPLKGARGIALERAEVELRGLRDDRRFMLVDRRGGFVSQRSHPRLALVRTRLEGEALWLEAPGAGEVAVPRAPVGPTREVEVWGDRCRAVRASAEASAFLSDVLSDELELVFQPDEERRPVDPDHASAGDHVSFADGFPVLLASRASLDDLSARVGEPVPMDRFRPNLVIEGGAPFDEDRHEAVRVGALAFRMPKRCARCQVTTVDQARGEVAGPEPLRTLSSYRAQGRRVFFGQNLVPDAVGVVALGAEVVWLGAALPGTG
jgi:uncharacterized protein YcbX